MKGKKVDYVALKHSMKVPMFLFQYVLSLSREMERLFALWGFFRLESFYRGLEHVFLKKEVFRGKLQLCSMWGLWVEILYQVIAG